MFLFLPIVSTLLFCCTPNLLHPRGDSCICRFGNQINTVNLRLMPVKISSRNGREEATLLTVKVVCWRPQNQSWLWGVDPHAFNQNDQTSPACTTAQAGLSNCLRVCNEKIYHQGGAKTKPCQVGEAAGGN